MAAAQADSFGAPAGGWRLRLYRVVTAEMTVRRHARPALMPRACAQCGSEGYGPGARFCQQCGSPLPDVVPGVRAVPSVSSPPE